MLRCVYADLDRTVLGAGGAFLRDASGAFTLLGARALEACDRAGAELVVHASRPPAEVAAVAALLGLRAWIAEDVLGLDGEELAADGLADAVARHMRARDCAPDEALAVGAEPGLEAVVGTLWIAGDALEDPLLRLELEERAGVRTAEEAGPAALYEAVITTLAEGRTA